MLDNILPLEAMEEIYRNRLNEMFELNRTGKATIEDFAHIFNDAIALYCARYEEISKDYKELSVEFKRFGHIILDLQKQMKTERRIMNLFLKNHRLEDKYESFEARILEKLFVNQEKTSST